MQPVRRMRYDMHLNKPVEKRLKVQRITGCCFKKKIKSAAR